MDSKWDQKGSKGLKKGSKGIKRARIRSRLEDGTGAVSATAVDDHGAEGALPEARRKLKQDQVGR